MNELYSCWSKPCIVTSFLFLSVHFTFRSVPLPLGMLCWTCWLSKWDLCCYCHLSPGKWRHVFSRVRGTERDAVRLSVCRRGWRMFRCGRGHRGCGHLLCSVWRLQESRGPVTSTRGEMPMWWPLIVVHMFMGAACGSSGPVWTQNILRTLLH